MRFFRSSRGALASFKLEVNVAVAAAVDDLFIYRSVFFGIISSEIRVSLYDARDGARTPSITLTNDETRRLVGCGRKREVRAVFSAQPTCHFRGRLTNAS